jgi:glycosyltransferase involved in cell wall biosynthesis
MTPNIISADYLLNPAMMEFNRDVEIHVTRFHKNPYPLSVLKPSNTYKVPFDNNKAYRVLLLSNEPACSPNRESVEDAIQHASSYNLILCTDQEILDRCSNAVLFPYGSTWLNKDESKHPDSLGSYYEGLEDVFSDKEFQISFMATGNQGMVGYDMRRTIWSSKEQISIPSRFWSSVRCPTTTIGFSNTLHDGYIPNGDKSNLFNSQFSIIIENCLQPNYFSEKLIDCLITKTIPVYFGCPNIGDFFNTKGILSFTTKDEFLSIVNSINNNTYEEYSQYIEENFVTAKKYAECFTTRVYEAIKPKSEILLSVGILTVDGREHFFDRLLSKLKSILPQKLSSQVEIIVNKDNKKRTVGTKRNEIISNARGKYICFIDDDDLVSDDYFVQILPELEKDVDCIGFTGNYYVEGNLIMQFNHANKNGGNFRLDGIQYRPINHLNPIRTTIAKQIMFPEVNLGEDSDYSDMLFKSNLIKTEYVINDVMYHYLYDPKTTETQK